MCGLSVTRTKNHRWNCRRLNPSVILFVTPNALPVAARFKTEFCSWAMRRSPSRPPLLGARQFPETRLPRFGARPSEPTREEDSSPNRLRCCKTRVARYDQPHQRKKRKSMRGFPAPRGRAFPENRSGQQPLTDCSKRSCSPRQGTRPTRFPRKSECIVGPVPSPGGFFKGLLRYLDGGCLAQPTDDRFLSSHFHRRHRDGKLRLSG
jgi:hypothetical protein